MTQKEIERLVRGQMQQTLPDKDALWAKIESSLGEQKPAETKPAPAIRMQTVYRVMGAAACLMLILGGIGVFAAVSRHGMRYETAPMTADNAAMEQAEERSTDDADYASPAMKQAGEMDDTVDEEAVYEENAAKPDYGYTGGMAADAVQKADDAAPEAFAGEQNAAGIASSPLSSSSYADAAREWLTENAPEVLPTITNWDAPEVTQVSTLPADYAPVTDEHAPAPYWCIHFATMQDAELGAEDVYVDADGVVFALSERE